MAGVERSGVQQPAHTLSGRLEQARRWLAEPAASEPAAAALGQRAIQLVVDEGRRAADSLAAGPQRRHLQGLCDDADQLSRQLGDMVRRGEGDSPQAQAVAR